MAADSAPRMSVSPVARKSSDGEGHGDAVVAAGVDFGSVKGLTAGNVEAVVEFLDFGAHGAQIGGDQRDAIGLLDTKFLGVANADAVLRVGADGREDGQFINELRRERAGRWWSR